MTGKRLFVDTSKCIGCKACQVACQQWHSLPAEDTTFRGTYQNPPEMSGVNLTLLRFMEKEIDGKLKWLFFKDQCRHCETPQCKGACPRGAIKKKLNGVVLIQDWICRPDECITEPYPAMRPCQNACPFKTVPASHLGIPRWKYSLNGGLEGSVMRKCDFCLNRWPSQPDLGLPPLSRKPACMVTCPPGAIKFGPADKMWSKAKNRRNYLRVNGYANANIYPAGFQTHVIWVLTELPGHYGLVEA
jgi:Fe-S-cluster-containing dehydrogenase component